MTEMMRIKSELELHEIAIRRTGLENFGEPSYRAGLRTLFDAYNSDIQLSVTGWRNVCNSIVSTLVARLHSQRGWAEHPEVLREPIRSPLVIVGLPRTGTTALHRLLAVDRQFQGIELWLALTPMVRPPRNVWESNPLYSACVDGLRALYARTPQLRNAHEFIASEIEECGPVLQQNFVIPDFLLHHILPTYGRWWENNSSMDESYERYANVLRLISGGQSHRRWLLKSSAHMLGIGSLLRVFPDACIVQTHRDPIEAIPSFCSLTHQLFQYLEEAAPSRDVIGPVQCAYWQAALNRIHLLREQGQVNILDINHKTLLEDPLGAIQRIYDRFGYTLAPHTEQMMRSWISTHRPTKHSAHRYNDSWGVSQSDIRQVFAAYRSQHQFT